MPPDTTTCVVTRVRARCFGSHKCHDCTVLYISRQTNIFPLHIALITIQSRDQNLDSHIRQISVLVFRLSTVLIEWARSLKV